MKKILLLIILLGYNQEYGGVYSSTSSNQLLLAENSVWQRRKQTGTATVIKSTKKQSKVLDAYGELLLRKRVHQQSKETLNQ